MVGWLTLLWVSGAARAEPAVATTSPGMGMTVSAPDGRASFTVRGRVQLRETVALPADVEDTPRDVTMQTQLATARVWMGGHVLSPETRWVMQLAVGPRDYRDGATSPVFDAYLDLAQNPNACVRVGQAFVPFDRLRTIREFALQLPDRPRAVSEYALDRDLGVYLWSDHFGGAGSPVAYRLGVFGGSGIHQLAPHPPGALCVGRVELRPLGPIDDDSEGDLTRSERPGLALGLAAATNRGTTRARSTTSTTYADGAADYLHGAADVVFKWRGFAWESEVLTRKAGEETVATADGAPLAYTRSGWGAVTQASYLLSPRVEVVGRYGRMGTFAGTDPALVAETAAAPNEVGAGANVYLNGHRFKVQAGVTGLLADEMALATGAWSGTVLVDATF